MSFEQPIYLSDDDDTELDSDRCAAAQLSEFRACKREQGFFFPRACGGHVPHRLPSVDRYRTMAAVAPQPVLVDSPAGAPTSDCPIFFFANSEVVLSTPYLDWQPAPAGPGGQARKVVRTWPFRRAVLSLAGAPF